MKGDKNKAFKSFSDYRYFDYKSRIEELCMLKLDLDRKIKDYEARMKAWRK